MRQTSLKRTKRGYVRNLGRAEGGSQPKFYLGHDREEAIRRLTLITAMWTRVEERTTAGYLPTWMSEEIEAAKAIARGESPTLPPVRLSTNVTVQSLVGAYFASPSRLVLANSSEDRILRANGT
jgi:hypothetical protein